MNCHDHLGAKKHPSSQVPNGPLMTSYDEGVCSNMANDFRRAFLRHLEEHQTSMTTLSRETGVSLDVLKKLKTRPTASTTVENALLIAAFYGKSVNDFVAGRDASADTALQTLLQLLTPEERRLLEAQMLGLLASHGRK